MPLQLLLLQARHAHDPMAEHEHMCFAERCGIEFDQVSIHDLLLGPPTMAEARRFDGVLIGGSGDFYVSKENLPENERFMDFLRELSVVHHPMFASCFGFQAMVTALGGKVIHDPANTEVGTYELTLTNAGREDPLLGDLPEPFNAQMGHKDRASLMPEGLVNLAASHRAPLQALRIGEAPIWATQFHPELQRATNLERFDRYADGYAAYMSEQEVAEIRSRFAESPGASSLLRRFVELVFG